MDSGSKTVCFDEQLRLEAYRFTGLSQKFPNHFHEYYVIGLIEVGQRRLKVDHREYHIGPGDLLTFNPLASHACEQSDQGGLSYRGLNIKQEVMADIVREVWKREGRPLFKNPVQPRAHLAGLFKELHDELMSGRSGLRKEELLLVFMRQLLADYAEFGREGPSAADRAEIGKICAYLDRHYAERISLDSLSEMAGLNKFTLLRNFTRFKGITPYRYLETIRVGQAKLLLEQGLEPAEVAQRAGFSDQSHLTTYFNKFIGLTPGQYQSIFSDDEGEL